MPMQAKAVIRTWKILCALEKKLRMNTNMRKSHCTLSATSQHHSCQSLLHNATIETSEHPPFTCSHIHHTSSTYARCTHSATTGACTDGREDIHSKENRAERKRWRSSLLSIDRHDPATRRVRQEEEKGEVTEAAHEGFEFEAYTENDLDFEVTGFRMKRTRRRRKRSMLKTIAGYTCDRCVMYVNENVRHQFVEFVVMHLHHQH